MVFKILKILKCMWKGSEKCMFIVKGCFFMLVFLWMCWCEVFNYVVRLNLFGRVIV